jgi:nitrite reductase/ring-hydroxylating ferredoxin subunit
MADAGEVVTLADASALNEGGTGIRFDVIVDGTPATAFVIRHQGQARGYLNRCAHVAMELDWQPGEFFDFDRQFLVCATHGALYEPSSGTCAGGPCAGRGGLLSLDVFEANGKICWRPDCYVRPIRAR